jgi:hypothetical protein
VSASRASTVAGTLALLAAVAALGAACAAGPTPSAAAPPAGATTHAAGSRGAAGPLGQVAATRGAPRYAFLVRHAEKDPTVAENPPLSAAGQARALALADRLGGERITRVLATDTRRARDTAAPLATRLGLRSQLYDHRRLRDLAG